MSHCQHFKKPALTWSCFGSLGLVCVSALGLKGSTNCHVCHISSGVGAKHGGWWRVCVGGHLSLHCVCEEGGGGGVEGAPGLLLR